MTNGRYAHYSDNLLPGVTSLTASAAPSTSYALADLLGLPNARVRFGAAAVDLTCYLASSLGATMIAVPVSNASSITVTNGAGLNQALTVPTMPSNRIPLTAYAVFGASSASAFVLHFNGPSNLILGGGIFIGQYRTLGRNFTYGWTEVEDQPGPEEQNEYGSEYVPVLGTQTRDFAFTFPTARLADLSQLREFHRGARKQVGVFQPNPNAAGANQNEVYVGRWTTPFQPENTWLNNGAAVLKWRESSKGKPV